MIKRLCGSLLASIVLVVALPARGDEGYVAWSQVEAAKETREYKEKLRDGGSFDGKAKAYLMEIALPQLSLEQNRRTIDRVRRRMRELLLTEIADDKAFDDASRTVRDFMAALARDNQADPAVRVNATLLIGDMKARDGKPWPPASTTLAAAVRDDTLPPAVRVAAVAGLARHAEAIRSAGAEAAAAFAKEVGPAAISIATVAAQKEQSPAPRGAEMVWVTSRALAMLPVVAPAATKDLAATLMAIMEDASWPIDVRVRAAAAMGEIATPQSGVDAIEAIGSVRKLAISALEADVAAAKKIRAEQAHRMQSGGGPGAAPPGSAGGGPEPAAPQGNGAIAAQVARRDAWRLAVLADAVRTPTGDRGLAKLAGKDAEAASGLAGVLRENGITIDASPTENSLVAAIEALQAFAAGAAAKPAQPAQQPEAPPAVPAPEPSPASPFDTSPFGQ